MPLTLWNWCWIKKQKTTFFFYFFTSQSSESSQKTGHSCSKQQRLALLTCSVNFVALPARHLLLLWKVFYWAQETVSEPSVTSHRASFTLEKEINFEDADCFCFSRKKRKSYLTQKTSCLNKKSYSSIHTRTQNLLICIYILAPSSDLQHTRVKTRGGKQRLHLFPDRLPPTRLLR